MSETKKAWVITIAILSVIAVAVWLGIRSLPGFDMVSRQDYKELSEPELLRAIAAAMHIPALPTSARQGHMYLEGFQGSEVWASFELDASDVRGLQQALDGLRFDDRGGPNWEWEKHTAPLTELIGMGGHWDRLTGPPERIKSWWSLPSSVLSYWYVSWREGRSVCMCLFDETGGRFWFYDYSY